MTAIPQDFEPAGFSPGFLDLSGPYYLKPADKQSIVGLRVLDGHANYLGVAHGGVLTTFADVALSYQIHVSQKPALVVASSSLTTNFLASAKSGDWLEAECRIDRLGRRLAYASGVIRRGEDVIMTMSGVYSILRER